MSRPEPLPTTADEIRSMLERWQVELLEAHASGKDVQFFRQSARPESLLLFVTVSDSERYNPDDEPATREAGAA